MQIKRLFTKDNKIINGPVEIIPKIYDDGRGYFCETWNYKDFKKNIDSEITFFQDNQSLSKKGVLRGLHYQLNPFPQGKLVRATTGKIFDVIVDLRENSETFSSWTSLILCSKEKNQIWIPNGFAHGFLTLSEEAIVEYKVTNLWNKDLERTIIWNDSDIAIDWPQFDPCIKNPELSHKDKNGSTLSSIIKKGEIF
tara:strand:+ start:1956 stop:2543 length:588 start_codon:yes stop_codon:yes gene_type:complete